MLLGWTVKTWFYFPETGKGLLSGQGLFLLIHVSITNNSY